MNFKHSKNLQESIDGMKKIFSISWSPNLMRIAVAHVDEKRNVRITLYDENGEKQETFPTRPANKNNKSYVVREIAFSPDSTKLAVSQSDNIVFIYNLGLKWGDKKTICNKFEQNTQVTNMIWPINKLNELYFGVAEGKIKAGILKSNNAQILYSTESYVVGLCISMCGKFLLSGHLNQSIYKHSLESGTTHKILVYSSIPYCLSWTYSILIAGNDNKVSFFNETGEKLQDFDYSYDITVKDFTVSRSNSSGELIAVGNFDKFFIFIFNTKKNIWEEAFIKKIENYFTITAMCWRPDISSLVTGSLCGSLDIFESCLKKSLYGDKFELIYLSQSQVMIKNLENLKRIILKSSTNSEITKINIYHNQYIVVVTKESLIIGDINSHENSEILWNFSGTEKFDFTNDYICMIYNSGEISIVEFGNNEVIGYCRTEYIHPNLISARINYMKSPYTTRKANSTNYLINTNANNFNTNLNLNNEKNFNSPNNTQTYFCNSNNLLSKTNFNPTKTNFFTNNYNNTKTNGFNQATSKVIAFLLDLQTIYIQDLINQSVIAKINHDSNLEFLDLNRNGSRIIYRDSKKCLYIYYINENKREILLNFCGFVQWVPNTDVLVAQDIKDLYVWYHIDDHENNKIISTKGEVEEVRRLNGKTEVLVDEGGETQIYLLDENLINLFQAIEDSDLPMALNIIESISFENKSVSEIYWKSIAKKALEEFFLSKEKRFIFIAQRCYAAVGAFSKVKYLKDLTKNLNEEDNNEIILIQAKLLLMDKQFLNAENLLLVNNLEKEAINLLNMYHKYEDSLRIAEQYNFPEAKEIKEKYLDYLIKNKIYDRAGLVFEKEGNFEEAIKFYIEGNFILNSVNLILREKNNTKNNFLAKENLDLKLIEFLKKNLISCGLFEKCAEFTLEIENNTDEAVDLYIKGNKYDKALNLVNKNLSENKNLKIKKIEENWGDYLSDEGLNEQAISHYLESGNMQKIINCYIINKRWNKAIELVDKMDDEKMRRLFCIKIAENFKKENDFEMAEKYYNKASKTNKIL